MRITDKDIERIVERINSIAYPSGEGSLVQLDWAYGGTKATFMNGVDISGSGYTTRKNIYIVLVAFKQGLLAGRGELR